MNVGLVLVIIFLLCDYSLSLILSDMCIITILKY